MKSMLEGKAVLARLIDKALCNYGGEGSEEVGYEEMAQWDASGNTGKEGREAMDFVADRARKQRKTTAPTSAPAWARH